MRRFRLLKAGVVVRDLREREAFRLGRVSYPADWLRSGGRVSFHAVESYNPQQEPDAVAARKAAEAAREGVEREPETIKAALAERRWQVETGGVEVGGHVVRSDRESRSLIVEAHLLDAAASSAIPFKTAAGWTTVERPQLRAIALALREHVQACFRAERDVAARVDAGEITSSAEAIAAFDMALGAA